MSIVLDASTAIAWLFEDEHNPASLEALRLVVAESAVVPSLWRLEVANVLRNAQRRGRCDEAYIDHSLDRLARLPIVIDGETDDRAWGATLSLSREMRLTSYDAAYLELALRRNLPLASGDKQLVAAAGLRGVVVIS